MSIWDHISNPAKYERPRDPSIRAMQGPADTAPMFAPYQRHVHVTVYRTEPIKQIKVQRPLNLDDEFTDSFPLMAAALTQAHRLGLEFEWTE